MNFKIPSWSDKQQWQTAIVDIGSLHWVWDTFPCSVITYSVTKRKPLAPPHCATNTKSVWEKTGNIKNPPAPKLPTSVETGLRPFWSFKVLKGNGKAAHKLHTSQAEMRDRVPPKNQPKYGNTKNLIEKSKIGCSQVAYFKLECLGSTQELQKNISNWFFGAANGSSSNRLWLIWRQIMMLHHITVSWGNIFFSWRSTGEINLHSPDFLDIWGW